MKKILILTASYPDFKRSATRLCTHRIIGCVALSERYEVHVLCYRYKNESKEEYLNGVHVHRLYPSLWVRVKNYMAEKKPHSFLNRIIELVQKTFTIPTFPITQPISSLLFFKTARALHEREHFEMVISEHHGLDTLITGCKLKQKFTDLKHISVFWDPLKGQIATVKLPLSFTNKRIGKLENYTCRYSTLQISLESMRRYHMEEGDVASAQRVYLDIPSILVPEKPIETKYLELLKKNTINIVYSGQLSITHRNPIPIIRLLNQCKFSDRINLVFFSMGADKEIKKESLNFRGNIICHEYISLKELHTIYYYADFLLNISHINPNMVPSKIFEYLSYGKPIISTFETDGDSAEKYLKQYKESICIDLKRPEIENIKALNNFFTKNHTLVPFEVVRNIYKKNTPEKYLEVIENVINI